MADSFNLLTEPWIPVIYADGSVAEVSIKDVFADAHDIQELACDLPTVNVAIFRTLLAILRRSVDEDMAEDSDYWAELWEGDTLPMDAITDYLDSVSDRFDLLDSEKPFLQTPGLRNAKGVWNGLGQIIADSPKEDALFVQSDPNTELSYAKAAQWLIHTQNFDYSGIKSGAVGDSRVKGGKGYPIGPGWTGQIGTVTVVGENLERTLLLNTVVCEDLDGLNGVDPTRDLAPWEREPDGPAGSRDPRPTGPVHCYTWQTRRVLLHGDDDGVTGLFLGNGDKATPQNRYLVEPMTAWRYSEPQSKKLKAPVYMPRKLPTDRAFWRGLSTLVAQLSPKITVKNAGDAPRYRSPGVVSFYQDLMYHEIVPLTGLIPLHAVGIEYGAQEAVVTELVDDVLSLPAGLLNPENRRLLAVVREAMEETEQVAAALRKLAAHLDRARGGSPDTTSAAREHAGAAFYQVIDERFPRWLAALDKEDPDRAHVRWREQLRSEALRQQEALASAVPDTAFAGRGEGQGRTDVGKALFFFRRALNKAIPAPAQQDVPVENNKNAERTPA